MTAIWMAACLGADLARTLRAGMAVAALATLLACGGGRGGAADKPPAGADQHAPVVTLTAPADLSADLTGTLTLSATASDDLAVTAIEFEIDGQPVAPPGSGASHSVSLETTAYASGQHIVRVRALDAAGHRSAWSAATVAFGGSRSQPGGFARSELVGGLTDASAFAQAPDGRFFIAGQGGALRIVKNGNLLATPFLTLGVDATGERGLVGLALHPAFASTGWVYVYATTPEGGTHNRISRYTRNPANPDIVAPGSELRIADLPALSGATNHNGGALQFGADGKLYVGVGDNANGAQAPDLGQVFGKILRFNDDGSIPADNPVCTTPDVLACAVWARGLRNPFTLAVQPGSGRLHINDVGQNDWEEINLGAPAANYGWPASEGPTSAPGIAAPLFAYPHGASTPPGAGPGGFFTGCAVIGGAFYPASGGNFPAAYRASYFFTDLCSGVLGRLDLANNNAAYAFGQVGGSPVGMLVGLDGALHVLTRTGIVRFSVAP
jgi:glucose/arabinose dehydrogenase